MASSSWREPETSAVKAPPKEARCRACGSWIVTAPAGTRWVRGRCGNRRCTLYGEGQTVRLESR